ncbi:DUF7668 domain-containing protein [Sphingobium scionense]|uniref:DUF7668 domain-containing protein n=1 Tax=Sphingobium scionense TaxID=1404341 RepID=A0A7W6PXA4_9SPHN|nr:hypothetical protein [Sphingobium scionense]MBB4150074.1 hypothetical protein [Sphingobium scionense]
MLEADDIENPVPPERRAAFHAIADAFFAGDFALQTHVIEGVSPTGQSAAQFIADNIYAYGDPIAPLKPATWDRAVYCWMDGYWPFLVDRSTEGGDVGDLTLQATLRDSDNTRIEVPSGHVP